jgi:Leucine-rich repeat (LRR) protein
MIQPKVTSRSKSEVLTHHQSKILGFDFNKHAFKRKSDIGKLNSSSSLTTSQIENDTKCVLEQSNRIVLDSQIQASDEDRILFASFQCISVSVLDGLKSKHIQHVRLHGNGLFCLPDVLYLAVGLKELEVSWNRLASLNASIGNLTSLERLDISFNALVYIPSELSKCTSLTYLNFSDNRIKRISAALRLCRSLQEVHLEYNMLNAIPKFLMPLPSLRILTYHGNPCGGNCMHDNIETNHANKNNIDSQETDLECTRRLLADFNPGLLVLFDRQSGF